MKLRSINKFLNLEKKIFPIFSSVILVLIFIFFIYRHLKYTPLDEAVLIESDLNTIVDKLTQIDKECSILDFKYDRNFIDFLTIKSFISSEVGALNLAYPEKWNGPYLPDILRVQDKVYEVVKSRDGYYVVPGRGVILPNKLEMGKEIIIDDKTNVSALLKKGEPLNFNGIELARKLNFIIGDWPVEGPKPATEKFNETFEELGENLPYVKNEFREIIQV